MNAKNYLRSAGLLLILFLIGSTVSCKQKYESDPSLRGDFRIHLISLSEIDPAEQDILNEPQYIITDDQIKSFEWKEQLISFDHTVQNKYVDDKDFLTQFSIFAIVWNGEIIVEGQVLDLGGPLLVTHPAMYVLEPVGDPQFLPSAYRQMSSFRPDAVKIKDLSVILRLTKNLEENEWHIVFDDAVALEIKAHFAQDGRLIN